MSQTWFTKFARLGVLGLVARVLQDALNQLSINNTLQKAASHRPFNI